MNDREKKLITLVVVLLVLLIGYYIGYRPLMDQKDQLLEEISVLEQEAVALRDEYKRLPEYKEGILNATSNIDTILAHYPAGLSQESSFKMIFDLEDNFEEIILNDIEFTDVGVVSYSDDLNNEDTHIAVQQQFFSKIELPYTDIKAMLRYIGAYGNRAVLNELSLTSNEDNNMITTTLNMNLYAIMSPSRPYTPPTFDPVEYGNSQLFKAGKGIAEEEANLRPKDDKADFFITLKPTQADIDAQVIGLVSDANQSTYVRADVNEAVDAIIRVYLDGNNYYVNYDVNGDYREAVAFDLGEALELNLYSSKRINAEDLAAMNLTIINQTNQVFYVNTIEDDVNQPRLKVIVSEGNVVLD